MVGLCGSGGGMPKYIWYMVNTRTKFGGNWGGGWICGCQGPDVRVEGRMSGLYGTDVRALDPGMNMMNTAWGG